MVSNIAGCTRTPCSDSNAGCMPCTAHGLQDDSWLATLQGAQGPHVQIQMLGACHVQHMACNTIHGLQGTAIP
eukprot:1157206-Pelagomonas_calceolata.AAC.3